MNIFLYVIGVFIDSKLCLDFGWLSKGQLISEWLFGTFNFPKRTKNLMNFYPRIQKVVESIKGLFHADFVAKFCPHSFWMTPNLPTSFHQHSLWTTPRCWNRQFGHKTIHPTQQFTSIKLQMSCVITEA